MGRAVLVLSVALAAFTALASATPARAAQVGGVGAVASPGRAPAPVVIVPRATIPGAAAAVGTPVNVAVGATPGAGTPTAGSPAPIVQAPAIPVGTSAATTTPAPGSPIVPQTGVSPVGGVDVSQQELYYLYLSQLYGAQAPPSPAAQAEAAKNATDYFTNGAALTSVPTSGPAARYFTDGSQVATIPTSVIPSYSFAPIYPQQSQAAVVDAGVPPIPDAGPPPVEEPAEDAGAAPVNTSPSAPSGPSPTGPSETPPTNGELTSMYESLLALYPAPTVPAPGPSAPVTDSRPSTAPTEEPTESTPARPGPLARREARHSSTAAVVGALVGGIALGAILMFLGARMNPRPRTHA